MHVERKNNLTLSVKFPTVSNSSQTNPSFEYKTGTRLCNYKQRAGDALVVHLRNENIYNQFDRIADDVLNSEILKYNHKQINSILKSLINQIRLMDKNGDNYVNTEIAAIFFWLRDEIEKEKNSIKLMQRGDYKKKSISIVQIDYVNSVFEKLKPGLSKLISDDLFKGGLNAVGIENTYNWVILTSSNSIPRLVSQYFALLLSKTSQHDLNFLEERLNTDGFKKRIRVEKLNPPPGKKINPEGNTFDLLSLQSGGFASKAGGGGLKLKLNRIDNIVSASPIPKEGLNQPYVFSFNNFYISLDEFFDQVSRKLVENKFPTFTLRDKYEYICEIILNLKINFEAIPRSFEGSPYIAFFSTITKRFSIRHINSTTGQVWGNYLFTLLSDFLCDDVNAGKILFRNFIKEFISPTKYQIEREVVNTLLNIIESKHLHDGRVKFGLTLLACQSIIEADDDILMDGSNNYKEELVQYVLTQMKNVYKDGLKSEKNSILHFFYKGLYEKNMSLQEVFACMRIKSLNSLSIKSNPLNIIPTLHEDVDCMQLQVSFFDSYFSLPFYYPSEKDFKLFFNLLSNPEYSQFIKTFMEDIPQNPNSARYVEKDCMLQIYQKEIKNVGWQNVKTILLNTVPKTDIDALWIWRSLFAIYLIEFDQEILTRLLVTFFETFLGNLDKKDELLDRFSELFKQYPLHLRDKNYLNSLLINLKSVSSTTSSDDFINHLTGFEDKVFDDSILNLWKKRPERPVTKENCQLALKILDKAFKKDIKVAINLLLEMDKYTDLENMKKYFLEMIKKMYLSEKLFSNDQLHVISCLINSYFKKISKEDVKEFEIANQFSYEFSKLKNLNLTPDDHRFNLLKICYNYLMTNNYAGLDEFLNSVDFTAEPLKIRKLILEKLINDVSIPLHFRNKFLFLSFLYHDGDIFKFKDRVSKVVKELPQYKEKSLFVFEVLLDTLTNPLLKQRGIENDFIINELFNLAQQIAKNIPEIIIRITDYMPWMLKLSFGNDGPVHKNNQVDAVNLLCYLNRFYALNLPNKISNLKLSIKDFSSSIIKYLEEIKSPGLFFKLSDILDLSRENISPDDKKSILRLIQLSIKNEKDTPVEKIQTVFIHLFNTNEVPSLEFLQDCCEVSVFLMDEFYKRGAIEKANFWLNCVYKISKKSKYTFDKSVISKCFNVVGNHSPGIIKRLKKIAKIIGRSHFQLTDFRNNWLNMPRFSSETLLQELKNNEDPENIKSFLNYLVLSNQNDIHLWHETLLIVNNNENFKLLKHMLWPLFNANTKEVISQNNLKEYTQCFLLAFESLNNWKEVEALVCGYLCLESAFDVKKVKKRYYSHQNSEIFNLLRLNDVEVKIQIVATLVKKYCSIVKDHSNGMVTPFLILEYLRNYLENLSLIKGKQDSQVGVFVMRDWGSIGSEYLYEVDAHLIEVLKGKTNLSLRNFYAKVYQVYVGRMWPHVVDGSVTFETFVKHVQSCILAKAAINKSEESSVRIVLSYAEAYNCSEEVLVEFLQLIIKHSTIKDDEFLLMVGIVEGLMKNNSRIRKISDEKMTGLLWNFFIYSTKQGFFENPYVQKIFTSGETKRLLGISYYNLTGSNINRI